MTTGASTHAEKLANARTLASQERGSAAGDESERAEIRRAAVLGCWIWPAFTLLDVYMLLGLYPEVPMWPCLTMRAVCEVGFVVAYVFARRPEISVTIGRRAYMLSIDVCALFISIMAIHFGGLTSVYMHGLSIAMLVLAVCLPSRGSLAMLRLAPVALMFPAVMGLAAPLVPEIASAWTDPHTMLVFGSNYAFVAAGMIVGAIASHMVWSAQHELYQARKLGRYRLEAQIGQGGMNQVWLAWDAALERNVALKILRSMDAQRETVLRFEREAKAASQLISPHTIQIFDFGASDDGIHYIAMEYLRGADLAKLISTHGPIPPARAVHFAVQACASLTEAHAMGIVHRDIKPHNLYVIQADGDPDFLKLLDFGIASRIERAQEPKLTRTGAIAGTPSFMAPEMIRGEVADARTDIYSLGATLYFMLTGTPPFDGQTRGVMLAHVLDAPEPPSTRGVHVPAALEQVVLRCLAKQPDDRFQSTAELSAALLQSGCGDWTAEDAQAFWQLEHAETMFRYTQATLLPTVSTSMQ
jgi:hypothetical protein